MERERDSSRISRPGSLLLASGLFPNATRGGPPLFLHPRQTYFRYRLGDPMPPAEEHGNGQQTEAPSLRSFFGCWLKASQLKITHDHLRRLGPAGVVPGAERAVRIAQDDAVLAGPEQGLLRVAADLILVGEPQLALNLGLSGVAPEQCRKLLAGNGVSGAEIAVAVAQKHAVPAAPGDRRPVRTTPAPRRQTRRRR